MEVFLAQSHPSEVTQKGRDNHSNTHGIQSPLNLSFKINAIIIFSFILFLAKSTQGYNNLEQCKILSRPISCFSVYMAIMLLNFQQVELIFYLKIYIHMSLPVCAQVKEIALRRELPCVPYAELSVVSNTHKIVSV